MGAKMSRNDGTGRELLKSVAEIAVGTASLTATGVSALARRAAKRRQEQAAERARLLAAQAEAVAVAAAASVPATDHARQLVTAELARRVTAETISLDDMADLVVRAHSVETLGELAVIVNADPRTLVAPPRRRRGAALLQPGLPAFTVGAVLLIVSLSVWGGFAMFASPLIGVGIGRLIKKRQGAVAAVAVGIIAAFAVLILGVFLGA
jgi:hypothetical protein